METLQPKATADWGHERDIPTCGQKPQSHSQAPADSVRATATEQRQQEGSPVARLPKELSTRTAEPLPLSPRDDFYSPTC